LIKGEYSEHAHTVSLEGKYDKSVRDKNKNERDVVDENVDWTTMRK
jgi:hypothetical protein